MNQKLKGLFQIFSVILLFFLSSYFIGKNLSFFESFVENDIIGISIYMVIEIISIVIAPVTTLPFIVLASRIFGWLNAGIYSLIAWTIGSVLAFIIARRYGHNIVRRFISLKKLHKFEKRIPDKHLFFSIILLRILFPMDILSYALGLFSKVSLRLYTIATIIGLIPLAFGIAYLGEIPLFTQLIILIVLCVIYAIIGAISILGKKENSLNKH